MFNTILYYNICHRGGFRGGGWQGPGPPFLGKTFGCLYRDSLKRDWSGPPLRSVSGPPLMKISGSSTVSYHEVKKSFFNTN